MTFSKFAALCTVSLIGITSYQAQSGTPNLPGYACDKKGTTQLSDTNDMLIACLKETSAATASLVWKPMTPVLMDTSGNITADKNITVGGSMTTGSTVTAGSTVKSLTTVEATTGVKVGTTTAACTTTLSGTLRMNGSSLEFCNGASWVSLSTPEPPKGTICGYATNGDTFDPAASYCKGFNVRHGCPEGYAQSHWYVTDWGNGHLWFCTKQ